MDSNPSDDAITKWRNLKRLKMRDTNETHVPHSRILNQQRFPNDFKTQKKRNKTLSKISKYG